MKIILEKQEAEEIFFNAMCNGLGYVTGYDLELDFDETEYKAAATKLRCRYQTLLRRCSYADATRWQ